MDSMLIIYKKDNKRETVSCDRWYNILNEYTTDLNDVEEKIKYEKNTVKWYIDILSKALSWYNSLTKEIIDKDFGGYVNSIPYIENILEDLKKYDENLLVRFIMDYINDEEYWDIREED